MMTENLNLQRALIKALDAKPGVEIIDKVKVENIVSGSNSEDNWPTLHLSNGRTMRARLLVSIVQFVDPSFDSVSGRSRWL